jgi:16S rRNA (uracil1498-N3)-methyltransferase
VSDRFFVEFPLVPGPVTLDGDEAHHLASVGRARPGDRVRLFNGDGREYPAVIVRIDRRTADLDVAPPECPERELSFSLEVAAPLPKGDRAQFLVEKLTELGVTRFVPLQTRRSVVHLRESKQDKLRRWVVEASKQCGRNVLMEVMPLMPWDAYHAGTDRSAVRLLADLTGEPRNRMQVRGDRVVAVGPEGGFTEEETAAACAAGWVKVGLGPRILRVETAAVALAALAASG